MYITSYRGRFSDYLLAPRPLKAELPGRIIVYRYKPILKCLTFELFYFYPTIRFDRGHAVVQLIEALY
jgi:hypothetical protein